MRSLIRLSLLLLFATGLPWIASAQTITLTGQVTDRSDRSPLVAMVSKLPAGQTKTLTDAQGRFSLELSV